MAYSLFRSLMQERVSHQRNAPTADANGGDVANFVNVATGLRCAIWPVQEMPEVKEAFDRRDIVVSHVLVFGTDIGVRASDRLVNGTDYYVVEDFERYRQTGVLPHPLYCVGANLRTV